MSRRRREILWSATAGGSIPAPVTSEVFDVSVWTGNASARSITTGLDMDADEGLVWIKATTSTAAAVLFDTLRGVNNYFSPHLTSAVAPLADSLTAFNADGYSLGAQANVNAAATSYVGWSFKRAPRFFDVITWTGTGAARAIPHSLGVEPGAIIVKRRDSGGSAAFYHRLSGVNPGSQYMLLPSTALPSVNDVTFGGLAATADEFYLGDSATVNASGGTYVAYVFAHDPDGIIQAGKYIGNGLADGPTIDLGWEPQYILIRRLTGGTGQWALFDTTRGIMDGTGDQRHLINDVIADTSTDDIDITVSGFKITTASQSFNISGSEYIYLAIRAAA